MKKNNSLLLILLSLVVIQLKAQTRSEPQTINNISFKSLDQDLLQRVRSQLNNSQWNYQLPASQASAATNSMEFNKKRPTVVVMIHGITGYPTTDPRIGTLRGARNYWGYDFVMGLMGTDEDKPTTFFDDSAPAGTIGKPDWENKFINSKIPEHHFITIYGKPKPASNFYTPFSLMMTYRDGSNSFKTQVAHTAAQIASLYNSSFGNWPEDKKPQLILLGHSFGGLIARTICSNPENIPSNKITIPAENFSKAERTNMEFIRNKTLYIVTLATPHEGSPIHWNAKLGTVMQKIPVIGAQIDQSDPDNYTIRQLTPLFINNLNKTVLHPEKCKRHNGTLVPVHALGGRVPAGPKYFSDPNQNDKSISTNDGGIGNTEINKLDATETNRDKYESYNLMRVDYAMHLFFGGLNHKPWGVTPSTNTDLDLIKLQDVNIVNGCLINPHYNPASMLSPRLYYLKNRWINQPLSNYIPCSFRFTQTGGNVADGEIDSDGFVPINSSLGATLGTTVTNFFDHLQGGSWYRFYRSGADFHNHGSIKFHKDVGIWLRENIVGNNPTALLFGTLDVNKAAGPKVATQGTVSVW